LKKEAAVEKKKKEKDSPSFSIQVVQSVQVLKGPRSLFVFVHHQEEILEIENSFSFSFIEFIFVILFRTPRLPLHILRPRQPPRPSEKFAMTPVIGRPSRISMALTFVDPCFQLVLNSRKNTFFFLERTLDFRKFYFFSLYFSLQSTREMETIQLNSNK